VIISDPAVTKDGLRYHIQTLQGALPPTAGPCVLFIDPLGRPLSPVSVAGVRRRDMRRGTGLPRGTCLAPGWPGLGSMLGS
jgi:hypothetical protein